jgi:hypothetical protein
MLDSAYFGSNLLNRGKETWLEEHSLRFRLKNWETYENSEEGKMGRRLIDRWTSWNL